MNRQDRRRQRKQERKSERRSPALKARLADAVRARQAGRSAEAAVHLERLIADDPRFAEALHFLGLLRYEAGRFEAAADLMLRAVEADDTQAQYHANCGAVLNVLGRAAEAEAAARFAITLDPRHAEAHSNLSVALDAQGKRAEARAACERAIQLKPAYPEAYINLGNFLLKEGKPDGAAGAYGKAAELAPENAMARANLGVALRLMGDLDGAEAAARRAIALQPGYPEAHNGLGLVFAARGRAAEAEAAFREAIRLRPGFAEAHVNLGAALYGLDRVGDSEAAYRQALALYKDYPEALNGLGVVLLAAGRLDDAEGAFRDALRLKPAYGEAAYNLASSGAIDRDETEIAAMETRVADADLPAGDRAPLQFALGEIRDRRGEVAAAFAHFKVGNELRKAELRRTGRAFDAGAHDALIDRIAGVFDAAFFRERGGLGDTTDRPVFVLGMPRSGTTLIEQIVASHPDVHGKGELGALAGLAENIGPGGFPENAAGFGADAQVADSYLAQLTAGVGDARRVVDKTPFNFLYLGLIAVLFPRARVIHCRRAAPDTCLSCYFQDFRAGHPWANDLEDLGRYFRAYARLMDHWRQVLPIFMLDVTYEDVVAEPESASRRIVDFLGLPWNAACLEFHATKRTVRTASQWQVRKPISPASVGRSERYREFIGPLEQVLRS